MTPYSLKWGEYERSDEREWCHSAFTAMKSSLFQDLMGFGQGKYELLLLVTMELPLEWHDFNLAVSGGNTHTVGKTRHHSVFHPVQSKMIPPSNHQVKVLHKK